MVLGWLSMAAEAGCPTTSPEVPPGQYGSRVSWEDLDRDEREFVSSREAEGTVRIVLSPRGAVKVELTGGVTFNVQLSRTESQAQPGTYRTSHRSSGEYAFAWFRGSWTATSDGVRLALRDRRRHVEATMHCALLVGDWPVPTLGCRTDSEPILAFDLGPAPSPWVRIEHPADRCGPWLVAGAEPGLVLRWENRYDAPGTLEVTLGPRE